MRKLITRDVFKMARIIHKANAKEEIKQIFQKVADAKDSGADVETMQREAGMEVIAFIIDACGNEDVEKAIYDLIAGIAEKDADAIKNQSLDATIELLKAIAKENDIQNFFSVAVKSV